MPPTNVSPRALFYVSSVMPYVAYLAGMQVAGSMTGGHGADAIATALLGILVAGVFGLLNLVVGALLIRGERRRGGAAGWGLRAAWAAGGVLPVAIVAGVFLLARY